MKKSINRINPRQFIPIKPISIGEATKQVLASMTAMIFTLNGLVEYAGKALYFEKLKTKKIFF